MTNKDCTHGCVNGRIYLRSLGTFQPCPDCTTAGDMFTKTEEEVQEIYNNLNIPAEYDVKSLLDDDLVKAITRKQYSTESIQRVTGVMKEINTAIHNKHTVKRSMYIYAPTVDLKMFAYNALLRGVEEGITVAPLISINTLYDIQMSRGLDYEVFEKAKTFKGAFENLPAKHKQFYSGYMELERLGVTYNDFLNAELLFVEATANTTEATWFALADILAERENRNLATYILGYYSEYQLRERGARFIVRDEDSMFKLGKFETHGLVSNSAQTYRNNNKGNYGGKQNTTFDAKAIAGHIDKTVQQPANTNSSHERGSIGW